METTLSEHEINDILNHYRHFRGLVVDAVEQELGESSRWQFLRSRLLRYLGESGLEGKLRQCLGVPSANEGRLS